MDHLSVKEVSLHAPPLESLVGILQSGLTTNFADVSVKIVECPDLTAAPFGLAAPGIGGATRIADVGGVPNLTPKPKPEKVYSLPRIMEMTGLTDGALIGPGAGNSHFVGEKNCV